MPEVLLQPLLSYTGEHLVTRGRFWPPPVLLGITLQRWRHGSSVIHTNPRKSRLAAELLAVGLRRHDVNNGTELLTVGLRRHDVNSGAELLTVGLRRYDVNNGAELLTVGLRRHNVNSGSAAILHLF